MKSNTCKGTNNKYLEEYHSETAAGMGAEEIQKSYGYKMTPFQCRSCGYWHLKSITTRQQCLICTDSSLFLKDLYSSKAEAEATVDRLRREKKVQLYPYKCPHSNGWHLSKKQAGKGK